MEETEELVDVRVKIPASRIGDFYRVLGEWMDGPPLARSDSRRGAHVQRWGDNRATDVKVACVVLQKLSPPGRRLFRVLISNPGVRYAADQLAELASIENGRYGIAGVLAWPTRYCDELRRPLPIEMEARDGGSIYWMDEYVAGAFVEGQAQLDPAAMRD
jgi:hypothetical protein